MPQDSLGNSPVAPQNKVELKKAHPNSPRNYLATHTDHTPHTQKTASKRTGQTSEQKPKPKQQDQKQKKRIPRKTSWATGSRTLMGGGHFLSP